MDLIEYNASLIWYLVPFDSIMFALSKASIKLQYQIWYLHWHSLKSNLGSIFYLKELCVLLHSQQDIHHPHAS